MTLQLPTTEAAALIKENSGQIVKLDVVDEKTIKVGYQVQVNLPLLGHVSKNVSIDLIVDKVEDKDVFLHYSTGNFGGKALVDLLFAAIPMLVFILAIRLDTGEKALFRQKRVGRNGALFDCFKFRTMKKDAPSSMSKKTLENADGYITRTGSFLRKTSLDELPQLFNIIKGEMSFIGPRPLIPDEKKVHTLREQYGVYQIRPGISGYAQIHGRDMITDEEKAALDSY